MEDLGFRLRALLKELRDRKERQATTALQCTPLMHAQQQMRDAWLHMAVCMSFAQSRGPIHLWL